MKPATLVRSALLGTGLALGLVCGAFSAFAHCQVPPSTASTAAFDAGGTMRAVAGLLATGHLDAHPVDDLDSEYAFGALFDSLDPLRLVFLQSDLDGLRADRDRIDDFVRAGDDRFAEQVERLYEQRLHEAAARAQRWLTIAPDFAVDEQFVADANARGFAKSPAELDELWRQRVKLDRLALEHDGVSPAQAVERLQRRYARMGEVLNAPVDVTTRLLDAVTASYDPHTTYLSPRSAEDFAMLTRLAYEGIGAVLGDRDGRITITKVIDGSPARASGQVAVGDAILAVGADDGSAMVPVDGLDVTEVVDHIRGPAGTRVRLQLASDGKAPWIVTLERRRTELADRYATGELLQRADERVGWIRLEGFYADPESGRSATADVARLLARFRDEGASSVVVDLRANGGGLLSEAVSLSGLFLDGGNVVRVEGSTGRTLQYDDPDGPALWRGPLIVLTSRLSASASEIFAGAIQDHGRGIVVGDTQTHGKGTVQAVVDLADRAARRGDHPSGALKLTIQQFFRPGGDSTQRRGVHADVVLPAWTEAIGNGEAELPRALPFRRIDPLVRGDTAWRNAPLVARLAAASAERVAADPEFAAVERTNAARTAAHQRARVPLERAAYAAYRAATKVTLLDDDPAKEPEAYRTEVCRIAHDYVAALHGVVLAAH